MCIWLGPIAGQLSHFVSYAKEPVPYAHQRFSDEYDRLLAVLDVRLRRRECIAGDYSIADMAAFPWIIPYRRLGNDLDRFPEVRRWFDAMKSRPAVRRGVALGEDWKRTERGREYTDSPWARRCSAIVEFHYRSSSESPGPSTAR